MEAVSATVKELHSYALPESLAVDVSGGSEGYLKWVLESTAGSALPPTTIDGDLKNSST